MRLKDAYGVWQQYLVHFPKAHRFTLGSKIDGVFLDAIEFCFLASYTHTSQKIPVLDRAIARVDLLKLLLQLAWDIGALDTNKYADLGQRFVEIGKMLGGWKRQLINKTPGNYSREKQKE